MRRLDRSWIWILDKDAEFRTLIAGFAIHFHFDTFDFIDFAEAKIGFRFYRDHVRKYPSTHCLYGVIASSSFVAPAEGEEVSQWLLEIAQAFPGVKTLHLDENRPRTVAEIFKLFEQFKQ